MNVRQSWSRHGEEVKTAAIHGFEVIFVTLGVFSPVLIIMFTM